MTSQALLRTELDRILKKTSLLEVSKQTGMHPSALSEFRHGRRQVRRKAAEKYFKGLVSDETWKEIEQLFDYEEGRSGQLIRLFEGSPRNPTLSEDQFWIDADPVHSILLHVMDLEDFKPKLKWIAHRAGVDVEEARTRLERLARAGLILIKDDCYYLTGARPEFTDGVPGRHKVIRRKLLFDKAEACLKLPPNRRDYYDWICCIDPDDIPELKLRIRELIKGFERNARRSRRKRVYAFLTSLFPLSR